jgi:CHASE3 domain sensor protein
MSTASRVALTAARGRSAIRRELATTPGRLRLAVASLALGALVFGLVAAHAAVTRRQAVKDVTTSQLRLVKAVDLSAHLSDAHATAARSFLVGGPERAASRIEYDEALKLAGVGVADLAGEIGTSSRDAAAVRLITHRLSSYAGLIDTARANYRQGFPVAGAYLRRAASTMRDQMLPSAGRLYAIQARRLTASYDAGISVWTMLVGILAGGTLLVLLAATQIYISRVTRRVVNPLLALATTILVGLVAWIAVAFLGQQRALTRAQRDGSDPVELLTATRILASRAQADESVALSARGGSEGEPQLSLRAIDRGFRAVTRPIEGLLDQAAETSGRSMPTIRAAYRTYLRTHGHVVEKERRGDFRAAVDLAVGRPHGALSTSDSAAALDGALAREIRAARGRFRSRATDAGAALDGLSTGIPLLTAMCGLLAMLGVRRRLDEYR